MKKYFLLLLCLFLVIYSVEGQDFKKIIKESKDDSVTVDAYTELMRSFGPNRIDSVSFYANRALKFFKDKKYSRGECIINLNMANVMLYNGGLAEAESYCKEAIKIAESKNLPKYLARGYDFMTVVYGKKGEFVKSTEFAYKSLRANEKLDDKRGIIASYLKLSAISLELKKPKESISYADIADSINKATLKTKNLEIGIIGNKALALMQLERLDEALEIFNSIYQIAINNPEIDDYQKPSALLNMGRVYTDKKDYRKALTYFRQSLEESLKYNIPGIELKSIQNIAAVHHYLGDYRESNKEAFVALEKSRAIKTADIEIDQLKLIAENYKKLKDIHKALEYTSEYYDKLISFNDAKNEKDIKELESVYRLEKTEEKLTAANQLSDTRRKQRDLSIVFAVVILCFMLVFAYAYHKIRRLNKQNIEVKKQLSESNQLKDKLFSIIGHDLRTAYAGILGFLYMIKEKQLDEDETQLWVDKVISQSHSAVETLDNLLMWGYTQIKGGKQLNITDFSGFASVNKNIEFLTDSIRKKNIYVENLIPENFMMTADENHFLFITRNLISNAIKFTPDYGKIIVGYKNRPGDFHEFYVKDNGVGISKDRLVTMFTSAAKSTGGTRKEKGTGLGLLLCKEFAEMNGGKIRVESKEGEGTTFYFTFKK